MNSTCPASAIIIFPCPYQIRFVAVSALCTNTVMRSVVGVHGTWLSRMLAFVTTVNSNYPIIHYWDMINIKACYVRTRVNSVRIGLFRGRFVNPDLTLIRKKQMRIETLLEMQNLKPTPYAAAHTYITHM